MRGEGGNGGTIVEHVEKDEEEGRGEQVLQDTQSKMGLKGRFMSVPAIRFFFELKYELVCH